MPLPFSSKRVLFGGVLGLIGCGLAGQTASGQSAVNPAPPVAHTSLSTKMRLAQAESAFGSGNYDLAETRITAVLSNASLLEVLEKVASGAGLKVKVEPSTIAIVPLVEDCGDLMTLEVRVPPSFLRVPTEPAAPTTNDVIGCSGSPARMDAKVFLESSGVTFPPGSSAVIYGKQESWSSETRKPTLT